MTISSGPVNTAPHSETIFGRRICRSPQVHYSFPNHVLFISWVEGYCQQHTDRYPKQKRAWSKKHNFTGQKTIVQNVSEKASENIPNKLDVRIFPSVDLSETRKAQGQYKMQRPWSNVTLLKVIDQHALQ